MIHLHWAAVYKKGLKNVNCISRTPIILQHCASVYKKGTYPMLWNIKLFMLRAYRKRKKPGYSLAILSSSNCCRTSQRRYPKKPFSQKSLFLTKIRTNQVCECLLINIMKNGKDRMKVSTYQPH